MKLLKELINPWSLLLIPVGVLLLYVIWNFYASWSFDEAVSRRADNVKAEQGVEVPPSEIEEYKEKRQEGDFGFQPTAPIRVTTLPFPQEVSRAKELLADDAEVIEKQKAEFNEKMEKMNEARMKKGELPIEYSGRPSYEDQKSRTAGNVLKPFFLALLLGLALGWLLSLKQGWLKASVGFFAT